MIDHTIQYKLKSREGLLIMTIVTKPITDDQLMQLCDYLFESEIRKFNELEFYFFQKAESADQYVYNRFVVNSDNKLSISECGCFAMLIKDELSVLHSPPQVIKIYKNPRS